MPANWNTKKNRIPTSWRIRKCEATTKKNWKIKRKRNGHRRNVTASDGKRRHVCTRLMKWPLFMCAIGDMKAKKNNNKKISIGNGNVSMVARSIQSSDIYVLSTVGCSVWLSRAYQKQRNAGQKTYFCCYCCCFFVFYDVILFAGTLLFSSIRRWFFIQDFVQQTLVFVSSQNDNFIATTCSHFYVHRISGVFFPPTYSSFI